MIRSLLPIFESSVEIGLVFAILAMGLMLTYKILGFYDLSIEGTYPLGAFIFAVLATKGLNPFLGMIISIIGGLVSGLLTYLLYKKLKMEPLLSGILTMTMLYSINLRIGGGSNVPLFTSETIYSILSAVPGIIITLVLVIVVKLLIDYFLSTDQGYLLKVTGDNRDLVKSLGKDPDRYVCLGLMLSNGLIALSGSLMAQHQGFADSQMGATMIVTAMASIIIGDSFLKNNRTIKLTTRAIIGAIIYRLIYGLAIHLGLEPGDLKLITAVIVIVFIAYNNISPNSKEKTRRLS